MGKTPTLKMGDVPLAEIEIRIYNYSVNNAGYPTFRTLDDVGERQL